LRNLVRVHQARRQVLHPGLGAFDSVSKYAAVVGENSSSPRTPTYIGELCAATLKARSGSTGEAQRAASQQAPGTRIVSFSVMFIQNAPLAKLHSADFSTNQICREFAAVLGILQPSAVQKYFGIDKKQRRYFCPKCFYNANRDGGFEDPLAVLRPKGPDSTSIYCLICDEVTPVLREECTRDGCLGNVLSADERLCLTCSS
jgi:hypothetical protein